MYPITLIKQLDDIEICGLRLGEIDHPDFKYPWELIAWHSLRIVKNLQFKIKSYGAKLKVKKDGGEIDAITAATISSRAFCDAIMRAWNAWKKGERK